MCMYMYVRCICMYRLYIWPLGPRLGQRIHHHAPKTRNRGPAPGGPYSQHPKTYANPLYPPIPVPPLDPIFLRKSMFGPVLPRP